MNQDKYMRMDETAWLAGFAAGEAGALASKNPYPAPGTKAWSWESGYIEGKAKRDGYEYSNPVERRKEREGR